MNFTILECICYDDACHLKKYAGNTKRSSSSEIGKLISNMQFSVDKFHFGNHIDRWCKKNCNPYKNDLLRNVCTYLKKIF